MKLNELVAEHLDEWTWQETWYGDHVKNLLCKSGHTPGGIPDYAGDISEAWRIVEKMRDMWTNATSGVSGANDDFERPFDDGYFFERLHRNADRRWPWAFLYVTPDAICLAALLAFGVDGDTAWSAYEEWKNSQEVSA